MQHKNLFKVLANYHALYLKTHCYHWNIKGSNFLEVHKTLGNEYEALIEDVDSVAERLRVLEQKVPFSHSVLSASKDISDANENLDGTAMIKDLVDSNKKLISLMESTLSDYEKDVVTTDLLTQKLDSRGKTVWFLSSVVA